MWNVDNTDITCHKLPIWDTYRTPRQKDVHENLSIVNFLLPKSGRGCLFRNPWGNSTLLFRFFQVIASPHQNSSYFVLKHRGMKISPVKLGFNVDPNFAKLCLLPGGLRGSLGKPTIPRLLTVIWKQSGHPNGSHWLLTLLKLMVKLRESAVTTVWFYIRCFVPGSVPPKNRRMYCPDSMNLVIFLDWTQSGLTRRFLCTLTVLI